MGGTFVTTSLRLKEAWKRFRSRFWLALLFDAAMIVSVFLAIHAWQTRDLPIDQAAPETVLALLDGSGIRSAVEPGQAGIVYFMAPWCFYCRTSIDNLQNLVDDGQVNWGTVVALDYGDIEEVQIFIDETGVTLPVLMGNAQTAADWQIRAFPTYYVVDANGEIHSRSVGYSTLAGMWFRSWLSSE